MLQGPTEVLPVSSSGHLVLLPALLRSPYRELDDELRKAFEVALHAGTAAALAVVLSAEIRAVLRELDAARVVRHGISFALPAAAALGGERLIEQRLGGTAQVAIAQVVAGAALGAADTRPAVREHEHAGALDHAFIGVAQAAALVPGVSRNGAALTVCRLRGFRRDATSRMSRHAALPLIVGAAALKGFRLTRRGLAPELRRSFAAGAAASFVSTLASRSLVRHMDAAPSYLPFAVYRVALGVAALRAARRGSIE